MRLTRRSPHPLYGLTYELQSYECRTCGEETHRSADGGGFPHALDVDPTAEASKQIEQRLEALVIEDIWVEDFIGRLAGAVRQT